MAQIELIEHAEKTADKKINHSNGNLILLSIMAGFFISFGGLFAILISAGSGGILSFGVTKTLMGLAFSVGLILVMIAGAELFTGSTVTILGWLNKKMTLLALLKNWGFVYLGNFIGSIVVAIMLFWAKEYEIGNGAFAQALFSVANSKISHGFGEALILGIFCNMLVCLAIWMVYGAKNNADKVLSIVFPITAFIALGFEHSVANMYLIPQAIIIKIYDPSFLLSHGISAVDLNWIRFTFGNLLPVTIGNIIGGILIWYIYWRCYSIKNRSNKVAS